MKGLSAEDKRRLKILNATLEPMADLPIDVEEMTLLFDVAVEDAIKNDGWALKRSNDEQLQGFRAWRSIALVASSCIASQNQEICRLRERMAKLEAAIAR
jgi:hypothetical protein